MTQGPRRYGQESDPGQCWIRPQPELTGLETKTSFDETESSAGRTDLYAMITLTEYIQRKFLPGHISTKHVAGRRHYQAILKHIINPEEVDRIFGAGSGRSGAKLKANPNWPYMGGMRLCDVLPRHVQALTSMALEQGYSIQTVMHIRHVVSAVFSYAIREGSYLGRNPATLVELPQMQRQTAYSLSLEQTVQVLQAMCYPESEMTLFVLLTEMNISEICGLQWRYVNLANHTVNRMEDPIPSLSIAVRKQWYRGELGDVPEGRRKYVQIFRLLRSVLLELSGTNHGGWNEYVLSSRLGTPINQINIAARRLKSIGARLELPWLSWLVLRRTRMRLAREYGVHLDEVLERVITPHSVSSRTMPISNSEANP